MELIIVIYTFQYHIQINQSTGLPTKIRIVHIHTLSNDFNVSVKLFCEDEKIIIIHSPLNVKSTQ